MDSGKLFSPRQIGVCGGSRGLSQRAVEFCKALGRRLAQDPYARIVSGGTKQHASAKSGEFAADWLIVNAASEQLSKSSTLVSERIVTIVREDEGSGAVGFSIGSERRARGKTGEARRISFVRDLDALIAVGGGMGTRQELALAIEHDIPVLPVPTFPGAAQEVWKAYGTDLIRALRINKNRATRWQRGRSPNSIRLAREMVDALFASLPRRCFVIMPFHEDFDALLDFVIEPAVRAAGDEPIRLDRLGTPGDVNNQIDDGLRNCEYSIAVLDGHVGCGFNGFASV